MFCIFNSLILSYFLALPMALFYFFSLFFCIPLYLSFSSSIYISFYLSFLFLFFPLFFLCLNAFILLLPISLLFSLSLYIYISYFNLSLSNFFNSLLYPLLIFISLSLSLSLSISQPFSSRKIYGSFVENVCDQLLWFSLFPCITSWSIKSVPVSPLCSFIFTITL